MSKSVMFNEDENAFEVFDLSENKSYGLFNERRDAVEALRELSPTVHQEQPSAPSFKTKHGFRK